MPDKGMLTEQGFLTEDSGMGFTPLQEQDKDPFGSLQEREDDPLQESEK